jgi:alpha-beta hydrolase superfamily lysophospholipase
MKRGLQMLWWILSLLLLLFILVVLYNQSTIISPPKRELHPYHREWLLHPENHSMTISSHHSPNKTPYLIVRYNPDVPTSKRIKALKKQMKLRTNSGVLVLFHGKNGRKEDLLPVAERYIALGFTSILLDLPAHGKSPLSKLYYATTPHEQHYLDEVLDDASKHLKLEPLSIWGMSLGGAFAIQSVAHSNYHFRAMVLVSTFDQLDGVLKDKSTALFGSLVGEFLYKSMANSMLFFHHFDPAQANSAKVASKLNLPLFMVHGKRDQLISYQRGEQLFKSFASVKKSFTLDPNGDHHNILVTKAPFYAKSGKFLLEE